MMLGKIPRQSGDSDLGLTCIKLPTENSLWNEQLARS